MTNRVKITDKEDDKQTIFIPSTKKLSDDINISVRKTPIITYSAENAFTFDISATESFSINYTRTNNVDDGNNMTNAEWITKMRSFINQWQSKHDGYILEYDGGDFYEKVNQQGYIKSFSTIFQSGYPEQISGSISFTSGTMRCRKPSSNAEFVGYGMKIPTEEMSIQITSSDNLHYYTVFANTEDGYQYNCVTSYSLISGPVEPFPSLSMEISKKRLMTLAPHLVDDILAGRNRITINACGKADMVVTKCSTSGNNIKITAYAFEEAYKGISISEDMSSDLYPYPSIFITKLLTDRYDIGGIKNLSYINEDLVMFFDKNKDKWDAPITFTKGTTVWHILSVCAMRLNCSIWFANNKAYVVDLSQIYKDPPEEFKDEFHYFDETLYLNAVPYSPEDEKLKEFSSYVQDTPELGDEGTDTLKNKCVHWYMEYDEEKKENVKKSIETDITYNSLLKGSVDTYGERLDETDNFGEMSLDDIRSVLQYKPEKTCDTQQSISFKMTEMSPDGKVWQSYFPTVSHVKEFIDHNSDTVIDNLSNFYVDGDERAMYHKLYLGSVERKFPDFSSKYTFGRIANNDLSETTSEILTAISNRI